MIESQHGYSQHDYADERSGSNCARAIYISEGEASCSHIQIEQDTHH